MATADGGAAVFDLSGPVSCHQLPRQALLAKLQPLAAELLFTGPPALGPGSFA